MLITLHFAHKWIWTKIARFYVLQFLETESILEKNKNVSVESIKSEVSHASY